MSYQFREVKCPRCDHVFMWNKDGICECLGVAFKLLVYWHLNDFKLRYKRIEILL